MEIFVLTIYSLSQLEVYWENVLEVATLAVILELDITLVVNNAA